MERAYLVATDGWLLDDETTPLAVGETSDDDSTAAMTAAVIAAIKKAGTRYFFLDVPELVFRSCVPEGFDQAEVGSIVAGSFAPQPSTMDRSPTSCDILLKGGRLDCGDEGAGGSVVGAPYKSSSSALDLTA